MSLLTQQTSVNGGQFYFVRANGQQLDISTLTANTIRANTISSNSIGTSSLVANYLSTIDLYANQGTFSTFSTSQIVIDSQTLNATPTELLLNGIPIATQSSLSSIADWSLDPAISTVQMDGNDLNAAGLVSSISVRAGNGVFNNLVAFNSLFVSSNTSTISSLIESASLGIFSTLEAGTISAQSVFAPVGVISSLAGDLAQFSTVSCITLSSLVANVSSIQTNEILVSSIVGDTITVSTLNGSTVNAGFVSTGRIDGGVGLVMTAERFSTVADNGIDVLNKAKVSLDAVNGLNGEINLSARPGYAGIGGTVNILAEGGVTPLGVSYGGEVNITATTGSFLNIALTSAVNLNAAGINSYAGVTSPIGSLAGGNFVHGDSIVNITAGVPPIFSDPLCVYLRGTNGILLDSDCYVQGPIRPYSDLVQNPGDLYIEDYDNGFAHGYIQLRGVSTQTFGGGDTAILGVNRVQFSTVGGAVENLSSINGSSISEFANVSTFADLTASTLLISSIVPLTDSIAIEQSINNAIVLAPSTITIDGEDQIVIRSDNANSLAISGSQSTVTLSAASSLSLFAGVAGVGNIQMYAPSVVMDQNLTVAQVATASTIVTSSISTAYIYGANPNLFGLGVPGLEINAANVWISSPQTNIAGFTNTSTVGARRFQGGEAAISAITLSSLTFTGLSSIVMSTSGTAGTGGQPAGRLMIGGNDLDLGQQDLWAQQVRVGAGNPSGSAQTEVVWYSPDNLTTRGLGLGGGDLTLRLQSTLNSGTNNGYLLDTNINKPFFSTINNSTCMMATIPSTNLGVFGISTLAVIPPKAVLGQFYSISTQNLAVNTPLVLYNEVSTLTVGGISLSTSAIVIPVSGCYELTTSIQFAKTGGGGLADFWFRKNGVDIPDTTSQVALPVAAGGQTLGNVTILSEFAAGDKIEVVVGSSDTGVSATFFQSTIGTPFTKPAVPSILTGIKLLNY